MSSLRRWALVAPVLAAAACSEIPFPEELKLTAVTGTFNTQVGGTGTGDLWMADCSGSLVLHRWTGSWTTLKDASVQCSSAAHFGTHRMAMAAPGKVWYSSGAQLVLVNGDSSQVEDHSAAAGLAGQPMFGGVFAFRGVAAVLAKYDPTGQNDFNAAVTALLLFEDGKFVSKADAPGELGDGAATMLVLGADDIWAAGTWNEGDPSWGNGFAKPRTLWHFDGKEWRLFEGSVDPSSIDPSFASTDLWAGGYQHFDGTMWQQVALPSPKLPEGATTITGTSLVRASNGGLVLSASIVTPHISGDEYLENGRNVDSGIYRWQGSDWGSFESFARNSVSACAGYSCGISVTGHLEDGTLISTHVAGTGSDAALVPFKP